jgi:hypothetical protein
MTTIMESDWTLLPKTPAEARAAQSPYYFDGRPCGHGHVAPRRTHNTDCYACILDRSHARGRRLREESRPARAAAADARKARREALAPLRRAAQREKGRHRHIEAIERAIDQEGNTEDGYALLAALDRKRRSPERERSRVRERRARGLVGFRMQRLRTPPWLTAEERAAVAAFYPAPAGHHVDHIIPISHELLAGLHVPGNLQHIEGRANIKKANVFDCTMEEAKGYVALGLAVWARDIDASGRIDWAKYPRRTPSR